MPSKYWCNCCFHKCEDNGCKVPTTKEVTSDQLLNFWTLGELPGPAELIEFIDIINNEVKSIVQSALIPYKLSELCFHCDWAGNTSLHLSDSNQCDTSLDITNDPNNAKVDDKLEKEGTCKIQKALPLIISIMTDANAKANVNLLEQCLTILESCVDLNPSCPPPYCCEIMSKTIDFFYSVVFDESNEKENLVVTNLSFNILIILVFLQASLNKFLELVLKLVTSHKFKTNKLNENFKKNSMTFLRVFTNVIKVMPKRIPETETLDSIQNVHSPSSVTVDSLTNTIMDGLHVLSSSYLKSLVELQNGQEIYVWETNSPCVRSAGLLESNIIIEEIVVFKSTILVRTSEHELFCKIGDRGTHRVDIDCAIVKMASHIRADRALVLSEDGEVYNLGDSSFHADSIDSTRTQLDIVKVFFVNDHVKIKYIACGDNYCAAINELGEVYTWGNNSDGRLGQGHDTHAVLPVQIKIPSEHKAVEVALGSGDHAHALVLTEFGYIYGFGSNLNGKLGVPLVSVSGTPIQMVKTPILVSTLVSVHPKHLYVGAECSFVLTQCGQVYSWGSGLNYLHGHSHQDTLTVPTLIADLKHKKVKQISVGESQCLAVTEDGHLYTWGQCSDSSCDVTPSRFYSVSNMKVEQCIAGTTYNFAWGIQEDNVQDESFVLELKAQTFWNLYELLNLREFVGPVLSLLELHCYLWYKRKNPSRQDIDKELKFNYISLLCTLIRQNVHSEQAIRSLKLFLGTFLLTLEDNINLLNQLLIKDDLAKYSLVMNNVLATLLSKRFSQQEIRSYFEPAQNPSGLQELEKLSRKMFSWKLSWASSEEINTTREYLISFISGVQQVLFDSSTSNVSSNAENIFEFLKIIVPQCVVSFNLANPHLDEMVCCLMPLLLKTMGHLIKAEELQRLPVSSQQYIDLFLPLLKTLQNLSRSEEERGYWTHTEPTVQRTQATIEAIQAMRTLITSSRGDSDILLTGQDYHDDVFSLQKAIAFFLGRCASSTANVNGSISSVPCRMKYKFLRGGLLMENLDPCDVDSNLKICGIPTVDVQNILFKHFYKGRNEEPPSAVHSLVEKTLSLALCCLVKQANIENMLQKHMAANFTEKSQIFITLTQCLVSLKIELVKRKHISPEEHEKLAQNIRLKCIFLMNEVNPCCDRQVYQLNEFVHLGKSAVQRICLVRKNCAG
ncbi:hypothetical protein M8J75_005794 [Diaphorina citri]|nr:hypothetical protein M8J75_005794 [Diaphorina citri]